MYGFKNLNPLIACLGPCCAGGSTGLPDTSGTRKACCRTRYPHGTLRVVRPFHHSLLSYTL